MICWCGLVFTKYRKKELSLLTAKSTPGCAIYIIMCQQYLWSLDAYHIQGVIYQAKDFLLIYRPFSFKLNASDFT